MNRLQQEKCQEFFLNERGNTRKQIETDVKNRKWKIDIYEIKEIECKTKNIEM